VKQSAGLVIFRRRGDDIEVLLVHPSGNYNRHAPWSIPKGLPDEGESLAEAARRETQEETGVLVGGADAGFKFVDQLTPLGHIDYTRNRKRIHAFAVPAPENAEPHPSQWEVDRAEFVSLDEAQRLIHQEQRPLLDRLIALLQDV
jgi:predicted NUDIX family NTP pyrophosphohydrolase